MSIVGRSGSAGRSDFGDAQIAGPRSQIGMIGMMSSETVGIDDGQVIELIVTGLDDGAPLPLDLRQFHAQDVDGQHGGEEQHLQHKVRQQGHDRKEAEFLDGRHEREKTHLIQLQSIRYHWY